MSTPPPLVTQPIFGHFTPTVGSPLTLELPGEIVVAKIIKVLNADTVVVELTSIVIGKSHNYRRGMRIAARRAIGSLGTEIWEVISDEEIRQAAEAERLAAAEAERQEKAKADAIAAAAKAQAERKAHDEAVGRTLGIL